MKPSTRPQARRSLGPGHQASTAVGKPDFRDSRNGSRQAISSLKALGVPNRLLYPARRWTGIHGHRRGFWERITERGHWEILEMAKKLYRVQVIHLHPDKPGGSARRTRQLNVWWARVRWAYAKRGFALP